MTSPLIHSVRLLFQHPGRVVALALAFLVVATGLNAQQGRGALKNKIRNAGYQVLIGMRPDSLSHGMISRGQSALSDNAAEAISRKLESKGLKRHGRFSLVPVVFGEVAEADLDQILDDPQVEYVEPDEAMPLVAHRDGFNFRSAEDTPWGITQVTAPAAWALGGSAAYGAGIKVAYLDSGGDQSHPDLLFAGGYNPVSGSTSDWNDDIAPCNGHGTHIAGTIAGRRNDMGVVGVAPEVSLYPIKVFQNLGGSCLAYTSSQISGLDWAVKNGIRVVSVSIGGTSFSSAYQSAISSAATKGTYLVAAAGNNGSSTMTYPGAYQDALSVASVDPGNNHSSWSNYGSTLFISAPGESILSTMPGGGYGYKSGTSMATPHVAGVVALVLARYPGISRNELLSRLQQGALDLGAPGRDDLYGYGLVRAREAMDGAPLPPPPPVPLALSVSPANRRDTVTAGASTADSDASGVSLTGDNSASTAWSASAKHGWTQLTTASGTGNGSVQWNRNPTGLAAGIYVDTITVSAAALSASVIDSLVVVEPPPPPPPSQLSLTLSPSSRYRSIKQGSAAPADSALVNLSGSGAALTAWTAINLKSWNNLTLALGVGSGVVRWSRNTATLLVGTYVDTITVVAPTAAGSPSWVIDSLVVTPLKGKRIGKTASSGNSVDQEEGLHLDSAYVDVPAGTTWEASTGAAWVRLANSAGTGPAYLIWQRQLVGLGYGISQDSIVVTSGDDHAVELVVSETVVVGADQVPASLAANTLFSASGLTELQQRMLDLLGNANGRYDVGDLLAYLDRTGYFLSPALMARVMALPRVPPKGN